jgi:uncharacterized membrane protein
LMPSPVRRILGGLWRWALAAGAALFLTALEIAALGYFPGLPRDTQIVHRVLWQLALPMVLAFLLSIVCAFAYDIKLPESPASHGGTGTAGSVA